MKFIDFFSGIGGFRLGLEQARHECVGHCEIDKYADKSYRAIHDVKEGEWFAADICRVRPEELPDAEIYCGGFPCQSFSIAGKRGGFEDTRGTLFFEVMRLAKVRKPKYLFLENVKGLLSHDGGQTFGKIVSTMGELGYDVEWQVLNSKDFGVPQNRERVFIIGHLGGKSGRKVFPFGQDDGAVIELQGQQNNTDEPRANTITARYKGGQATGTYVVECEQYEENKVKQLIGGSQGYRVYDPDGISVTLARQAGGVGAKTGLYAIIDKLGRPKNKDYASTITGGGHSGGNHSDMDLIVLPVLTPDRLEKRQNRIRRLTPKECFRLLGFSDSAFEKARKVNSDSQLYKQVGNAVTVNVIYEIGRRLNHAHRIDRTL